MSYAAKAIMFATLAKGGSMQISELTDYPGVTVVKKRETRDSKWTQETLYGEKSFKTILEGIEAWKLDQPEIKKD